MSDKRKSIKSILKDFAVNFSSHGIQRAVSPAGPSISAHIFRWIWLLTWLLAAVYMAYQMTTTISSYLQFKTLTRISVDQKSSVPFPAVTICTGNTLNRTRFLHWLNNCEAIKDGRQLQICRDMEHTLNSTRCVDCLNCEAIRDGRGSRICRDMKHTLKRTGFLDCEAMTADGPRQICQYMKHTLNRNSRQVSFIVKYEFKWTQSIAGWSFW